MKRTRKKFLNTLLLCLFTAFLLGAFSSILSLKAKDKSAGNRRIGQSKYSGEKITYDVMLGKVRLGRMRFSNIGNAPLEGRILNLMVMETKLTHFSDTERIYSDPQTLLPVKVERDIMNIFTHEKINEHYDQTNFTVTIIKKKGMKKQERLIIKKDDLIHNAALLPYYVRHTPNLDVGRVIIANLPTRRLEIELVSEEELTVPAGTFKAYHFSSTPRQIDIWISADSRRIPLKIQTSGALGYSMVMKEYSP
ncbi:MAG: DUF3108 domain-containing protein [Candidatus Omnitrophica bacterium]|nr:DUF3108 domain-containing protein [Candidatus Omnitrophota bacterium]MDD5591707.1 DUF3108 domain-containing protein [Candidatus Omnitrophota bacterium]